MEPVLYYSHPQKLFKELAHCLNWKAIIHLTVGDGEAALYSMLHDIPYIGVAMIELHRVKLLAHIDKRIFEIMQKPGNRFTRPDLVATLDAAKADGDREGD